MQPQAPSAPNAPMSGPSPNPQYDFILKDPQKPVRNLKLPKPALILVGLVGLVIVFVIIGTILSGTKTDNTQELVEMAGRAQEIARVSTDIQHQSNDVNTQSLAATTTAVMTSEKYQVMTYLGKRGAKVKPTDLLVYKNASTDSELTAALQNNVLEKTYDSYLQTSLTAYQLVIKKAAVGASKSTLAILNQANNSAQVLLAAPEIASN